ncbi:hypothetical protein ACT6QH_08425 [Xanthobacter sp. TB0139]|uniref:hypothetical protein n=1 Tax=Xanthobacter sp. TB0139 TaxID=3459178 RepID=UPI0040397108
MWVVVVVLLNALSGPETPVVQDMAYKDEAACKASIAAHVPAKLDARAKAEYENGYRRYVCVRVGGLETLLKAK